MKTTHHERRGPPDDSIDRTAMYLDTMIQLSSNGTLAFVVILPPSSASAASSTKPAPPEAGPQLPTPTAVDEGTVIGHAGLWAVEKGELVFMLGQPYWGQGYMTEVLAALVPVFWEYNLKAVYADVDPANVIAWKVLRNSGFKQIRKDIFESHHGIGMSLHMQLTTPGCGQD